MLRTENFRQKVLTWLGKVRYLKTLKCKNIRKISNYRTKRFYGTFLHALTGLGNSGVNDAMSRINMNKPLTQRLAVNHGCVKSYTDRKGV